MAAKRTTFPGFRDDRYRRLVSRLLERRKALGITQHELADFAYALDLSASELLAEVWKPLDNMKD